MVWPWVAPSVEGTGVLSLLITASDAMMRNSVVEASLFERACSRCVFDEDNSSDNHKSRNHRGRVDSRFSHALALALSSALLALPPLATARPALVALPFGLPSHDFSFMLRAFIAICYVLCCNIEWYTLFES
jgi:hypothetical protein